MISRRRDVVCFLENNKIFKKYKIIGLKYGLSNLNYIIESDTGKYIVRLNIKKDNCLPRVLRKEHRLLKFFESKNLDFVPRSMFYDDENNIHVLKYVEGKKIKFRNISETSMAQVVSKIYQINVLAEEFIAYNEENNFSPLKIGSEIVSVTSRILSKFTNDDSYNPYQFEQDWVTLKLKDDFKNYKIDKKCLFLNHGDLSDNLIINHKEIFIIDWEYAKITYGPGLVHVLAHGRLESTKEEKFLKIFSNVSGLDYDELYRKTYLEKSAYYLLKISKVIQNSLLSGNLSKEAISENIKNIENLKSFYQKSYQKTF